MDSYVEKTWDSNYVVCPYCGATHGDCWEWVTDTAQDCVCQECEKTFKCYAEYDVTYIAVPIKETEDVTS